MYFNIFSRLFVIHINIKNPGLASFLSVYVCKGRRREKVGGEMWVKGTKGEGDLLETYESVQGG